MSYEIVGWDYDTQEVLMRVDGDWENVIRVSREFAEATTDNPRVVEAFRKRHMYNEGGHIKIPSQEDIVREKFFAPTKTLLPVHDFIPKSPQHTRTDDSLVSWIASPFWALAWLLSFGRFGKPLWRVA